MKKIVSLSLALFLCLGLFGCSVGVIGSEDGPTQIYTGSAQEGSQPVSSAPESSEPVSSSSVPSAASSGLNKLGPARVAALKGPTAMGMALMMGGNGGKDSSGHAGFEYTLAASADEITPKLVQGELDIAAVPANLASVLYHNTQGQIQVLAVNTLGVLYLVENGDTVHSVEDLRGKTIYSAGKGATPEYALNYMLTQNGIDPETDVTIEWKSEHAECVSALAADATAVAMLPQPFVTTAQMKNETIRVAVDINEEWERLASAGDSKATLITGVVVARKEFVEEESALLSAFLQDYALSVAYVQENVDEAAAIIGELDIVPEAVAKKALPECNITFLSGKEMQEKLSGYLQTLYDQNPKAVGGAMPGDDFYYIG